MAKLDGLGTVLEFLSRLDPKISNQIAKKVLALNIDPRPTDSEHFIEIESKRDLLASQGLALELVSIQL